MNWIIYGILAMISFGLFNFFVKLSSGKINVALAVLIVSLVSALVAFLFLAYFKVGSQQIVFSADGIKYAILAGLFTGLAEIFYYFMFMKDAKLSIGLPLVVGGTVLSGTLLGLFILNETLTAFQITGLALTLLGIVFLSI